MSMKSLGQAEAANRSFGLETAEQSPGVKRHDDLVGLLTRRSRTLVDRPLAEACSVLPECYTDPGFFAFEVDRIFRPGWLCVGRESQIPSEGDFFCTELFGEPLVIVRGQDNVVRALSAVCRHRAALVAEGASSSQRLQCPYHKWTYDLTGRLISTPLIGASTRRGDDLDLPSFACDIWLGWIMVNLDGAAPPLTPLLADLARDLAPWRIQDMVPLCEPVVFDARYNWKIACDNQGESYHLIGTHERSVFPHVNPRQSSFTSDLKTYVRSAFPFQDGPIGPAFGRRLEGVRSDFNGTWSYNVFPNHLFVVTEDFVVWQCQRIRNHEHARHELWVMGHQYVADDPELMARVAGIRDGVVRVEGEDQASFRSVWNGLRAGSARPGPFAESEKGTWYWQRWLTIALTE